MTMEPKPWKITGLIATAVIVVSIPLSLLRQGTSGTVSRPEAAFTGGNSCTECHRKEFLLWKGSDHDNAMAVAADSTVLGNFNDVTFELNGKTSRFYRRDGKFFVNTEGPNGIAGEFEITHTFGIRPLQQYLVPFGNGRYQCLPIAWNTVDKKWFNMAAMVYTSEDLKPDNWLYWTNQAQNWNSMCAECHSTNLQKNFDPASKSYQTTWSDINVNCEACHGPGSAHIEWARLPEMARPQDENAGLVVRTSGIPSRSYVEACAYCHARRSSIGPYDYGHTDFLSNAIPQLPVAPFYFVDGQFLDEDYEYGSFTQSKMYMKDVRCGDCHDPHSLKRKFEGNALCTQCHRADEYDTYDHHMHKGRGEQGTWFTDKSGRRLGPGDGNLCRDCHMPGRFYMGIDKRFDHSMRIPRPDLSLKLGTPNACTHCHDDKTDQWALQYVNKWYGEKKKAHYATLLYAGREGMAGADSGLLRIINSNLYPEIIRAAAIGYLSAYPSGFSGEAVRKALGDPDPLLRYTAVENYRPADSAEMMRVFAPMLDDPSRAVRMQAANRLAGFGKADFNETQYRLYTSALEEYRKSLDYAADFPAGRYNLGNYYAKLKDDAGAVENYREAIAIDNLFYPAKINLGLLYYRQGQTGPAEALFLDLVKNHPDVQEGYYYLALLYGEQKRYAAAITTLEEAVSRFARNPRLYYNLGLLYQMDGQSAKCENTLVKGLALDPCNFDLLYALYSFHLNLNEREKAGKYIDRLRNCYPRERTVSDLYTDFISRR